MFNVLWMSMLLTLVIQVRTITVITNTGVIANPQTVGNYIVASNPIDLAVVNPLSALLIQPPVTTFQNPGIVKTDVPQIGVNILGNGITASTVSTNEHISPLLSATSQVTGTPSQIIMTNPEYVGENPLTSHILPPQIIETVLSAKPLSSLPITEGVTQHPILYNPQYTGYNVASPRAIATNPPPEAMTPDPVETTQSSMPNSNNTSVVKTEPVITASTFANIITNPQITEPVNTSSNTATNPQIPGPVNTPVNILTNPQILEPVGHAPIPITGINTSSNIATNPKIPGPVNTPMNILTNPQILEPVGHAPIPITGINTPAQVSPSNLTSVNTQNTVSTIEANTTTAVGTLPLPTVSNSQSVIDVAATGPKKPTNPRLQNKINREVVRFRKYLTKRAFYYQKSITKLTNLLDKVTKRNAATTAALNNLPVLLGNMIQYTTQRVNLEQILAAGTAMKVSTAQAQGNQAANTQPAASTNPLPRK